MARPNRTAREAVQREATTLAHTLSSSLGVLIPRMAWRHVCCGRRQRNDQPHRRMRHVFPRWHGRPYALRDTFACAHLPVFRTVIGVSDNAPPARRVTPVMRVEAGRSYNFQRTDHELHIGRESPRRFDC